MKAGLREYLGVPEGVAVYLDNGASTFGSRGGGAPLDAYEEFVEKARPDWKPIPQDYILFRACPVRSGAAVRQDDAGQPVGIEQNGYVPVVHIGSHLMQYTARVRADERLRLSPRSPWGR